MCGIVAKIKREQDGVSTSSDILTMFNVQKNRGQRGFGYVSFDKNVNSWKRAEYLGDIEKAIMLDHSRSIIFHHRLPTSTPNLADSTHPIYISHDELAHDYYFVHNGVITNDEVLHGEHVALGYEYGTTVDTITRTKYHEYTETCYNDSEALAIDVCRFIEGKQLDIKAIGSIAFIALQVNKKTGVAMRVFFGRNSNPLNIEFTTNELVLRSEGSKETTKPNKMYCLDIKSWEVTVEDVAIGKEYVYPSTTYKTPQTMPDSFNYDDYDYDYGYGVKQPTSTIDISDDTDEQLTMFQTEEIRKLDDKIDAIQNQIEDLNSEKDYYTTIHPEADITSYNEQMRVLADQIDVFEEEKDMIREGVFGN